MRYQPILADRLSAGNRQAIEAFLAGRESAFQLDARPRVDAPARLQLAGGHHRCRGRRRALDRPPPQKDALRLAAFGDSLHFRRRRGRPRRLPRGARAPRPGLDVANYGVPACGLDQAFLRYLQERAAARPQVVVIGYLSENICRSVSVFRPFYNPGTVFPLAKPRYLLDGGGLSLFANRLASAEDYRRLLASPAETLAELGRHDAFYRSRPHAGPADSSATVRVLKLAASQLASTSSDGCYGDDEALAVTTRLFDLFYETALADGAQPVILIFPTRDELAAWRSEGRKRYAPLLRFLAGKHYRVVDAMEVFDGAGRDRSIDELVPAHLSPLANTLVAEHLRQRLQSFGLIE